MEQQQAQQVEQQLRQNWQQVKHGILDLFAETSASDLDSARSIHDLVQRIADRSHHSERYVETRLLELAGVGAGGQQQYGPQGMQQQGFGTATGQQQGQQGQQGQSFGRQQ